MTPDARQSGTYELPRGSAVGKYEILRRLAVGGMAEIYLARVTGQAGFEKLVVLKRILPNVAEDPTFVQMFLEEARLAATLRHANIADVYDVGEEKGTYFFTMEYVYGQDARVMRHETNKRAEQIPLPIALTIIHGAASALEHAHEMKGSDGKPMGLVHRDVSASNVMVSYDGAVKLLDFGIARASSSSHKTQTGTLKGKIPYMSPEQCKGHPLDRRSDLFSLGVVLYELTIGRRPFRGDSDFAIMDQIVYKGAVPPSQMVRGYPPELEAIVMRLLERDVAKRYASAGDMLVELDEFVAKHGLWMSPRAVGKYMRTLFAAQIQAWEQAEQEGVPFAQHVVQSVTSQSQRSELVTPPSDFRALVPGTPSQEMRAQRLPDAPAEPIATMAPLPVLRRQLADAPTQMMPPPVQAARPPVYAAPPPLQPAPAAPRPTSTQSAVYPNLRPRSNRAFLMILVGALVLGAGGVVGYLVSQGSKKQAPVADTAEPQETRQAMPMTQTQTAKPEVNAAKPETNAAKPETNAAKPKTNAAKPETNAAKPETNAAKPEANAAKPGEAKPVESKPVETKPGPVEGKPTTPADDTKPAITTPSANPKPPIVKPKPRPKTKETPAWDPNSPFLPQ